ncbi:MAG: hypothetical protein U1E59_03455 [Amaricoccus sp.]
MTPATLRGLAGLVDARTNRDLARLEALVAEDRRLEAELAELASTLVREHPESRDIAFPSQALRYIWVEQRTRAACRRRSELAAAIRAARAAAVQSLGKQRALEELVGRAQNAEDQVRTARAEREAAPSDPGPFGLDLSG